VDAVTVCADDVRCFSRMMMCQTAGLDYDVGDPLIRERSVAAFLREYTHGTSK
jgi:hypothetical protein